MVYTDNPGNPISYDCDKLIEKLQGDIEEYGTADFNIRVIIEQRGPAAIYKKYYTEEEYFIALNEGDIHLEDRESFVYITAGELLEIYKKENSTQEGALNENYKKLDIPAGTTLDEAIKQLQACYDRGDRRYIEYNGKILNSDQTDTDAVYLSVTGMTKEAFDKYKEDYLKKDAETNPLLHREEWESFVRIFGRQEALFRKVLPFKKSSGLTWEEIYKSETQKVTH